MSSPARAPTPSRDRSRLTVLQAIERVTGVSGGILLHDSDVASLDGGTPEVGPSRGGRGNYQILGEIARGGMGTVLRGHDPDLGRDVALKILHREYASDPAILQRFIEEAQIGGQLQHPGVVPVYELGLMADERPYFAMKLVRGRTLAELLGDRDDASHGRHRFLSTFDSLCKSIAYAHSRGVIHRDLKPANVMVGAFGEVQVFDWGLAKVLRKGSITDELDRSVIATVRTRAGSGSMVGSIMGTPEYMPPEQAIGAIEKLDERSDVFALGAILCEILTGQPPYTGQNPLVAAARAELDNAHERLDACGADDELVNLARRCLAANRRDRPANAESVATAMEDHLASTAERAREAQLDATAARVKAAEHKKAQRLTLALTATVVLTALLVTVGYVWIEGDRRTRIAETDVGVTAAMAEATFLQGRENFVAALAVAERARSIIAAGEADADTIAYVESRIASLETLADAARRDAQRLADNRRLRARIEAIATIQGNESGRAGRWARRDRAYAAAFRDFDIDFATDTRSDIVARILASGIALDIAVALDEWARAKHRYQGQDSESALELIEIALEVDADAWRTPMREAMLAGDRERLRDLATPEELGSLPAVTANILATALDSQGDTPLAIDLLTRVYRRYPDNYAINLNLAHFLTSETPPRPELALRHLAAARAVQTESIAVLNSAGLALRQLGDLDAAAARFQEAIELDSSYVYAHVNLGLVRYDQRRLGLAIDSYRAALAIDPEFANAYNKLGVALMRSDRVDDALEAYRTAIELDPTDPAAHNNLGVAYKSRREYETAANSYREALALEPRYAAAHNNLGIVLQRLGRFDEAVVEFDTTLECDPRHPYAHTNLGRALSRIGHAEEALAEFENGTVVNPDWAPAHAALARAREESGDHSGAIDAWKRAVALRRDRADWCNSLAWLLATTRDTNARDACLAIEHAERAVSLDPTQGDYWNTLGVARFYADEIHACIDTLLESVDRRNGGDPYDWLFLAMAQHRLGASTAVGWLEKSRQWLDRRSSDDDALLTLCDEAEAMLGLRCVTDTDTAAGSRPW